MPLEWGKKAEVMNSALKKDNSWYCESDRENGKNVFVKWQGQKHFWNWCERNEVQQTTETIWGTRINSASGHFFNFLPDFWEPSKCNKVL